MTQAEWELGKGLDASTSIRRSLTLLQSTLQLKATSATAHALMGQAQVLEAQSQPKRRKWLAAQAQEQLLWAMRLNPADGQNARLKTKLARL